MPRLDKTSLPKRFLLSMQLSYLEEVAEDYHGQTIDNIIRQLQARLNEIFKQETV